MLQPKDRMAEWIQKQDLYISCLQETHFRLKDTYRLKVRGWKNIFHANGEQKKAGVTILISDKIDLKVKITRDKEGHYRMIKGSIQEERHNNCKYLCTQHRSSSINKTNTAAAAAAKSLQSCPTLCDPIDGQAPLSLGLSRQGHWSGLPFPSPMHESEKWKWNHSVVSDS